MMSDILQIVSQEVKRLPDVQIYGRVRSVQGLLITVEFEPNILALGSRCVIETDEQKSFLAEVVGFNESCILMMPFGTLIGVRPGCRVLFLSQKSHVYPHESWLGRVIDGLARPIDGKTHTLLEGSSGYPLHGKPLISHQRAEVSQVLDVGVRVINTFLTICKGQRMGIFAGSGVGKSSLMSMLAKYTACDVCVIGLVGERGREVKEFIYKSLGEEGLKKSIVVVSTSDEPALMRREAAYLTLTISEYFRDKGLSVLCMVDSVTRFAMAQREIGLSTGEPPTTKGYTPTVFAELPKLLERAGPGLEASGGFMTGIFTVLVDGDDHNEPIADAVRGILDGHIVLDRAIAERGHFPAINVLKSISRMVPQVHTEAQQKVVKQARRLISTYEDMRDMIRLGAYRAGSDTQVDEAIAKEPALSKVLVQNLNEKTSLHDSFERLKNAS